MEEEKRKATNKGRKEHQTKEATRTPEMVYEEFLARYAMSNEKSGKSKPSQRNYLRKHCPKNLSEDNLQEYLT